MAWPGRKTGLEARKGLWMAKKGGSDEQKEALEGALGYVLVVLETGCRSQYLRPH